ncbi:MAG: T9SS type A sorting domain-containing protein [Saprospiraceae bacterium]
MKSSAQIILLLIFAILINHLHAQTYQVTVSNEPFVFLENAQAAVKGPWELPEFQAPFGFNLEFFDITTDQLYSNFFYGIFDANQDIEHTYQFVPFYASLIDRGYQQDSALSPIKFSTIGPAGQRIFTLEFKEAGLFYGLETKDGVFLDYISFQLKLYEGTGDVEFHIGPYSILEDPEIVFDGNPGPAIGLLADTDNTPGGHVGEIILLAGNALKPTVVTDTIVYLNWPIPENTVYRFSRMGTSVDEHLSFAKQPILFPNPTFGEVNLKVTNANEVVYPIIVMDELGKKVVSWNTKSEISVAGLSAGCYFVLINTKNKNFTEKLIVFSK